MTDVSSDPICPELALVCHELATRARAELPERPWQLFPGACGQSPDVGRAPVAGVGTSRARRFSRALLLAVPAVGAAVVFAVMKVVADSDSTPPPAAVAEPAQSGIGPLGAVRSGGYVFADGVLQVSNNGRVV